MVWPKRREIPVRWVWIRRRDVCEDAPCERGLLDRKRRRYLFLSFKRGDVDEGGGDFVGDIKEGESLFGYQTDGFYISDHHMI